MSVRFDAAADRLSYTSVAPPTTFTITAWVYLSVDRNDFSTHTRVYTSGLGTVATWGTGSDGTGGPNYFTGSGSISNATNYVVGEWRKVAITRSGSSGECYVATDGGATEKDTGTVSTATPGGITLGNRDTADTSEPWNGRIAQVRVWDSVLTQTQIEAEWASSTPVITSGLWENWPLTTHTDLTGTANSRTLTAAGTLTTEDEPPNTGGGTTAPAGHASGTGTAHTPTVIITPAVGHASGTGTANNATVTITPAAGHASGTGTAHQPAVTTAATASAGHASGTGTAHQPTVTTGTVVTAGHASGTGTAFDAAVTTAAIASAGHASGTGTAHQPTVVTDGSEVTVSAGHASGTGTAHQPTVRTVSAPTGDVGSNWRDLQAILADGRTLQRELATQALAACPQCGEPLRTGPRGGLFCLFDGSRY